MSQFKKRSSSRAIPSLPTHTGGSSRRRLVDVIAVESLENRTLLSAAALTTLGVFNGANGDDPKAIAIDASGNIFGVTGGDTATQTGDLFEIPSGTSTIEDLYHFTGGASDGGEPNSLVIDSSGNLFGTTFNGGANGFGVLFEVPAGQTTPTTLMSFPSAGTESVAGVDSAGNVYGMDLNQSVFELPAGSHSITTIAQVDLVNSLVSTANGTLYGTTSGFGSSSNAGTVFQIAANTNSVTTLVSFNSNGQDGLYPQGIAVDGNGNVFGVTNEGGADSQGTAFEIVQGSGVATVLTSFAGTTAQSGQPVCAPVLDSSGDLIGFNSVGSTNGDGAVFEIAAGSTTATDIVPLDSNDMVQMGTVSFAQFAVQNSATQLNATTAVLGFAEPSAGAAALTEHPDDQTGHGEVVRASPGPTPPPPATDPMKELFKNLDAQDKRREAEQEEFNRELYDVLSGGERPAVIRTDAVAPDAGSSSLTAEFAQLKQMLAQVQSLLKQATPQINTAVRFYKGYNAETTTITRLNGRLAAQKNAAAQARLQQEIAKDQNIQDNDATSDNADCDAASTELDQASTLETNIQSGLNSLPAPEVSLSGAFTTVPAAIAPGQKISLVISVINSGNVTARGTLTVGLDLRPSGTTGNADVTLKAAKAPIRIASGASANTRLVFVIPKTLPAGSYSLVAQLDPNNTFKESTLPSLIVSATALTVG